MDSTKREESVTRLERKKFDALDDARDGLASFQKELLNNYPKALLLDTIEDVQAAMLDAIEAELEQRQLESN